jgi:predicted nucleic acid-binding protein
MGRVAEYLVDKSAWARVKKPAVAQVLDRMIRRGLVGTCATIDLEMLYSARNVAEHNRMRVERESFEWLAVSDECWERAIAVHRELCATGRHRGVPMADLIIAATAERHGVTVLHYDADFDVIAEVTGQLTRWVVPRGTAD